MKVYNLSCERGHPFEGWFSSEDDFMAQASGMQIECPFCNSAEVKRVPSAPHLNLTRNAAPSTPEDEQQAQWLETARRVINNTEDVGEHFPEEARRIYYQETAARGIRGVATADEHRALAEEGIEVVPFPIPAALKQSLQ